MFDIIGRCTFGFLAAVVVVIIWKLCKALVLDSDKPQPPAKSAHEPRTIYHVNDWSIPTLEEAADRMDVLENQHEPIEFWVETIG
jgi:hypothetical protein